MQQKYDFPNMSDRDSTYAKQPSQKVPAWMADPLVSEISDEKKLFLMRFKDATYGQDKNHMMMLVMNMMKEAKAKNISFTPQEIQAMIQAIKNHSSAEENAKIDSILQKASTGNVNK